MIVPTRSADGHGDTDGALREKTCEACGTVFECRAGGCWCDDVQFDAEACARLRARAGGCLCPTCLVGYQHVTA